MIARCSTMRVPQIECPPGTSAQLGGNGRRTSGPIVLFGRMKTSRRESAEKALSEVAGTSIANSCAV